MAFGDNMNVDDQLLSDELTEEHTLVSLRASTEGWPQQEKGEEVETHVENRICSLTEAKCHLQVVRLFFESCSFTLYFDFSS